MTQSSLTLNGLPLGRDPECPLAFFAPGKPQTAGSKSAIPGKDGGRPLIVESGNRAAKRSWRGDLRDAARAAAGFEGAEWPTADALDVTFVAVRARPKQHMRTGRNAGQLHPWAIDLRPTARPDTTKLVRAAEDALEGILWADDAAIVRQVAEKAFGDQVGLGVLAEGMYVVVRRAQAYAGPMIVPTLASDV